MRHDRAAEHFCRSQSDCAGSVEGGIDVDRRAVMGARFGAQGRSNLAAFRSHLAATQGAGPFATYAELHDFSVRHPEQFWGGLWDFAKVKASVRGKRVLLDGDKMPGAKFFPDARLNYAENLLVKNDDTPALIFRGEDKVRQTMSWRDAQ